MKLVQTQALQYSLISLNWFYFRNFANQFLVKVLFDLIF